MPAGTWTLPDSVRTKLLSGQFDLASGSWKMALFTSSSNLGASSTAFSGVTGEVANGNGYTSGGAAVSLSLSGTTSVSVAITTAPVWTASGDGITARYAAIYEVGGDILAYKLLDSTPGDVSVESGGTLTVGSDGQVIGTLA